MKRIEQVKSSFRNALRRLEKAAKEAKSELEIDGAIQRFEFTFELFWKLLKVYLESEGIMCKSAKSCLKEAYQMGIVDKEDVSLKMLDDRNISVHLYDKEASREIFERIKKIYVREFKMALRKMQI